MLAVELANIKEHAYQKLKTHPLISKLPVHLIAPIESNETIEYAGLETLEAIGFADALKSLDSHFISFSKKILVVEDNAVTLKIIRHLLSELDI